MCRTGHTDGIKRKWDVRICIGLSFKCLYIPVYQFKIYNLFNGMFTYKF